MAAWNEGGAANGDAQRGAPWQDPRRNASTGDIMSDAGSTETLATPNGRSSRPPSKLSSQIFSDVRMPCSTQRFAALTERACVLTDTLDCTEPADECWL